MKGMVSKGNFQKIKFIAPPKNLQDKLEKYLRKFLVFIKNPLMNFNYLKIFFNRFNTGLSKVNFLTMNFHR